MDSTTTMDEQTNEALAMKYYKRPIYTKMTNGQGRLVVAVEAEDAKAAFTRIKRIYGETHNPRGNWRIGWNWKEESSSCIKLLKEIPHQEFEDMRLNPSISIIRKG